MAKEKRATWWKMFAHQRAAIESISDADVGKGLKAAFRYFDGEDVNANDLTASAFTVFCVIRPYIDESIRDYDASMRQMMYIRWKGLHPNGTDEEFEQYIQERK